MEKELRRFVLDPNLLPPGKQTLLSDIAAQAASMNMPCYLVGGLVRDLLLQRPVNDLDIIVEGNAIQLGNSLVRKYGGKLTAHHKFTTAVWFLSQNHLDLITARSETYEYAGALPSVKPSTIEDDIRRRDFTVNAMAVRLDGEYFGELLDPLGGQNDLAQKTIRALHPRSFIDDPTRIFRAVRYEQRYMFKIAPDTLNLINQESLVVLSKLSGKRIRHEIDLIFEEENTALMLSRLEELGVLSMLNLPKFNMGYSGLLTSVPAMEFGISVDRVLLGYLLWLVDSPADLAAAVFKRLDFNSNLSAAILALLQLKKNVHSFKNVKPSEWTFYLEKLPMFPIYALWLITNESAFKEFLVKWRHIKTITTGNDLKAQGILPGPRYKKILDQLRAAWLDGHVKTEKEEQELLKTLL